LTFWLAVLGAVLVAGLLAVGVKIGWGIYEIASFRSELEITKAFVTNWQREPPEGIDPHIWREVTIVVGNGLGNVCFTPQTVSLAEMRRLRADVEARASHEPVSLELLDWLWRRLRDTGPHGEAYIDRMQPLWDEAKGAIELQADSGPAGKS
jgi:hypothetical protein